MQNILLFLAILFIFLNSSFSQTLNRDHVEEKYKWNLSEIYPSVADWLADVDILKTEVEKLANFKDKLGESSESLYSALKTGSELTKTLWRCWTYASNLSNENLNISENQALMQQMQAIGTRFGEVTAFFEPEVLQIPKEKIDQFFQEKPELAEFDMYINNIQRLRAHTLTEPEEKILASFNLIAGNQSDVYDIFNNAEMPFQKVALSTGEEVELTPASYTKYRIEKNRSDRENVMKTFFENYGRFKNTLGANLGGKVKKDWVYAKNRKY